MDAASMLAAIARRDARESEPFTQIVTNYSDLYIAWQTLARDASTAPTTSPGAAAAAVPADVLVQYTRQIAQLQAELANKYKSQVMDVSSRLNRETEVRTLTENARLDREALDRTRESLRETKARLDEEVASGARFRDENLTLRDELGRTRRLLERSEERVRILSKENADLMERLITEKLKMADELNRMNEINRDLQQLIDNGGPSASGNSSAKKPASAAAAASSSANAKTAAGEARPSASPALPTRTVSGAKSLASTGAVSSQLASALEVNSSNNLPDQPQDSNLSAFASTDEQARARSAESYLPSGPAVQTLLAHELEVPCVRFDESGSTIATCSVDGTVRLWGGSAPHRLDATLRVDSTSGPSAFAAALLAVDVRAGLVLATGSDRVARLWSTSNSKLVYSLSGHASKIYACKLTSDARTAVTAGTDRKAMIWDTRTGNRTRAIACGSICNALAVNESGTIIAVGHQDKSVRLWDLRDGKDVLTLTGIHQAPITSVTFFPGRNQLLTAARDDTLCVVDLAKPTSEPVRRFQHDSYRAAFNWSAADVSPNGAFVAAPGHEGKCFVWSVETGRIARVLESTLVGGGESEPEPVCGVAFSPVGGGRFVSVDKAGVLRSWVGEQEARRPARNEPAATSHRTDDLDEGYADRMRTTM